MSEPHVTRRHVTHRVAFGLIALGLVVTLAAGADRRPAFQNPEDDPDLPRVLLIGDSISIGYTVPVRKAMAGEANVHRIVANGGPTTRGLKRIDKWLGDGAWDVIHFNWGLHDLKYMGPNGENRADPDDPQNHQQVPVEAYRKNLEKLVQRMKETDATLIWASTTPVPEGAQGRVVGDAKKYNTVAAEIMKEHSILTNDLYAFAKPRLEEIQRPANVHFNGKGSRLLGKQVAEHLRKALKEQ